MASSSAEPRRRTSDTAQPPRPPGTGGTSTPTQTAAPSRFTSEFPRPCVGTLPLYSSARAAVTSGLRTAARHPPSSWGLPQRAGGQPARTQRLTPGRHDTWQPGTHDRPPTTAAIPPSPAAVSSLPWACSSVSQAHNIQSDRARDCTTTCNSARARPSLTATSAGWARREHRSSSYGDCTTC